MKILIGSLLFATAIFINFSELNSSPPATGARSSRNWKKAKVGSSYRGGRGAPPTYMAYVKLMRKTIELELVKIKDKYVAVDCRPYKSKFRIPTKENKAEINFMAQPFFKEYEGSFIKIVIYVEVFEDDEMQVLLGAKLPPKEHEVHELDDPLGLDPDETKYFITYKGLDYVVEYDRQSDTCTDVKLWGHQNLRPDQTVINDNWHTFAHFRLNRIYFLVFMNDYNEIVGAALDPFWTYRPGEENAHENPYADYQRTHKINIQKYRPITEYPNPRENVHQNPIIVQQHDAYHQRNPNPYEHLYTNQLLDQHHNQRYAHQNDYSPVPFDPSHYHAQQSGQSTPHFDPSQYYGQHSGHPPPPFDPFENWNNPPHHPPNP